MLCTQFEQLLVTAEAAGDRNGVGWLLHGVERVVWWVC
jgi:hypothetical protein